MKATSINIQPIKNGYEVHNPRLKELSYVNKSLTPLNESWFDPRYEGKRLAEIRQDIEQRYLKTVGQRWHQHRWRRPQG